MKYQSVDKFLLRKLIQDFRTLKDSHIHAEKKKKKIKTEENFIS